MRRRQFTILAALSLVLCVGAGVLWVRSYDHGSSREPDALDFTHVDPLYWIVSDRGSLVFCRQVGHDWDSPKSRFNIVGLELAGSHTVNGSSLWVLLIPFWMIVTGTLVMPAWWSLAAFRRRQVRQRTRQGHCPACDYDLSGNVSGLCPECGRPTLA